MGPLGLTTLLKAGQYGEICENNNIKNLFSKKKIKDDLLLLSISRGYAGKLVPIELFSSFWEEISAHIPKSAAFNEGQGTGKIRGI